MLSSSRLNTNGFSLMCWGSDLCRTRLCCMAPASHSVNEGTNTESLICLVISSIMGCFPPGCGTGVQGCQDGVEGVLQSAFLSSPGCLIRGKEGIKELERLEHPGLLIEEMDLAKDISLGRLFRACIASVIALIQLCISSGLSAWM